MKFNKEMHSFIQTDDAIYLRVMSLRNQLITTTKTLAWRRPHSKKVTTQCIPYTTYRSGRTMDLVFLSTLQIMLPIEIMLCLFFPFSVQRQSENEQIYECGKSDYKITIVSIKSSSTYKFNWRGHFVTQ